MSALTNRLASRKWTLTLLCVVLAAVAVWFGKIDGEQFVGLLQWLVGLYMAGNVASEAAGKITVTPRSEAATTSGGGQA